MRQQESHTAPQQRVSSHALAIVNEYQSDQSETLDSAVRIESLLKD